MKNRNPKSTSVSNFFGAFAKLLRTTESQGVTMSHWQKPIDNIHLRCNLAEYLKAGCPKINADGAVVQTTIPEGEEIARLILGDDYLSAEETSKAFGFQYSDAQLEQLAETLPTDPQALRDIRARGHMLIPGPNVDTHLLGVRTLDNQEFYSGLETDEWYAEDKEKFAKTDLVKAATWMVVHKKPVEDSTDKNWKEQQEQLNSVHAGNRVPNVSEMSYAIIAYFKIRNDHLFHHGYVRTSSVSSDGRRVYVGSFHYSGLKVSVHWADRRIGCLGVACAWERI